MAKTSGEFRFRKHDKIGANDAEDDHRFLETCFEDTGDADVLLDCQHPAQIALGRTGAGKTALILELQNRSDNVIPVNPEHLSFNYIANSNIIQYLTSIGINLEPFYKLLWRHVFAVTIIQRRFDLADEKQQKDFLRKSNNILNRRTPRTKGKYKPSVAKKQLTIWKNGAISFFKTLSIVRKRWRPNLKQKWQMLLTARLALTLAQRLDPLVPPFQPKPAQKKAHMKDSRWRKKKKSSNEPKM